MSLLDEAAGSLAAAADSIHPEMLVDTSSELEDALRFIAAAGSYYEQEHGPAIANAIHALTEHAAYLTRVRDELTAEANRLRGQ